MNTNICKTRIFIYIVFIFTLFIFGNNTLFAQVQKPDYILSKGFFVLKGRIYNPDGTELIMRGVNHTHTWGDGTKNFNSIPEIAKTGANVVRVCFSNWDWQTTSDTPEKRRTIVEKYIEYGMAPMVELHEATCGNSPSEIEAIVDNWLEPGNKAWLTEYEEYVILNIANEWGPGGNGDYSVWRDTYKTAITRLRDAGINNMLVIDAGGCGQNPRGIELEGQKLIDHDPQHNVVLSIHFYGNWRTEERAGEVNNSNPESSPWSVETELGNMQDAGLPIIVGEFGWREFESSPYETERVIEFCQERGIGWLAWSLNSNGDPLLDMVWDWAYNSDNDLREYGKVIINHPLYGLKTTAVRTSVFETENIKPVANITFPADSSFVNYNSDLILTVDANDSDGSVARVEFYNGRKKIGEDDTAPYTYTWENINRGRYRIAALVYDDGGERAVSNFVNITVGNTTVDKTALFVAGNAESIGLGDLMVIDRLQLNGFTVTVKDDENAVTDDALNQDLVLISSTTSPTKIKGTFTDVAVPVIVWESRVFDDMKMTGKISNTDYGTVAGDAVSIVRPGHPLAADLTGDVTVTTNDYRLNWGLPGSGAVTIATIPGETDQAAIFTYDAGAEMLGMTAPAKRIGFFFYNESGTRLNENGWLLFDAAVDWSVDRPVSVEKYESITPPKTFIVAQNYPNPFNPSTTIKFILSGNANVSLQIFDVTGRLVRDFGRMQYTAGEHRMVWNGRDDSGTVFPSGLYYYRLETNGQKVVKKMLLVK